MLSLKAKFKLHLLLLFTATAAAWNLNQFTNFVVFGDSYTDQGRYPYVQSHNGTLPKPHDVVPNINVNADGGRTWPEYVGQYQRKLAISNYAVSGASCSQLITPRYSPDIHQNWPSVREYQVPAFFNDLDADALNIQGVPTRGHKLNGQNTVYAIFIGTNDLGGKGFIDDQEVRGKSLPDYVSCVFEAVENLYKRGGRYFVLFSLIDLYETPLYANASQHGVPKSPRFWPLKPDNTTAASEKVRQYVQTVNELYKYRTGYTALADKSFAGAHFSLFNTEALIRDMYKNPGNFLNGTHKPYNVSDWVVRTNSTSPDSFLWYDELHPSEQVDRWIAKTFLDVVKGVSKYGVYFN